MIPEISITSGADYISLKQTFNEYTLIDPGYKIKNTNNNNGKTYNNN